MKTVFILLCLFLMDGCDEPEMRGRRQDYDNFVSAIKNTQVGDKMPENLKKELVEQTNQYSKYYVWEYRIYYTTKHDTVVAVWKQQ